MSTQCDDKWDAVVIGAGPAGTVAARALAGHGLRTLLVERERFPRAKLCGGCLAPGGQATLNRLGLGSIPSLTNAPRIRRLQLRTGGRTASFPVPAYRVIERAAFDQELVEAACAAGVEFRDGTAATIATNGAVELRLRGGTRSRTESVDSRITVVADGLKGRALDKHPAFTWRIRRASLVGLGGIGERVPDDVDHDAVTMFHGAHGYLGVASLGGGRSDIAGAISPSFLSAASGAPPLETVLSSFGLTPSSFGEIRLAPGIPGLTRRRARVEHEGRLFVCGDAAGYVEPFTGEGMSWALRAAECLARHAVHAASGRYRPGTWTHELSREWRTKKVPCRLVSAALRMPPVVRTLTTASETVPPMKRAMSYAIRTALSPSYETAPGAGI